MARWAGVTELEWWFGGWHGGRNTRGGIVTPWTARWVEYQRCNGGTLDGIPGWNGGLVDGTVDGVPSDPILKALLTLP